MRLASFSLLTLGCAALCAGAAVAQEQAETAGVVQEGPSRVLVLDAAAVGVDDALAKQVTAWVAESLHGRPNMKVLTASDMRELANLETEKALLGCEGDESCLSELSEAANADLVITSSVGKVGTEVVVNLALLDAGRSHIKERVSAPLGDMGSGAERVAGLVGELFGWDGQRAGTTFQLPEGEPASFAVFDLVAAGVSDDVVTNLTQLLSAEIKKVEGASVVGRDDIRAMLAMQADKSLTGCDDSVECLAEIGGALGVDRMIVGHVGQVAGQYVISLRLIAIQGAVVENRISETYRGDEGQLLLAVRHAGRRLLGLSAETAGTLAVSSPEAGARVVLDGEEVGALPLKPIGGLAPGRHTLQVAKEGFVDFRSDVYVNPNDTTSQWVELERVPVEWYQSWVFWTSVVGVSVATVAAGVGAAVVAVNLAPQQGAPEPARHPFSVEVGVPDQTTQGAAP